MAGLNVECGRKIKIKDDSRLLGLSYWVLDAFCRSEKKYGNDRRVESLLLSFRGLLDTLLEKLIKQVEIRV